MGHFLGLMRILSWDWKLCRQAKAKLINKADHLTVHTHTHKVLLYLIILAMITLQLAKISCLKLKLSSWCMSPAFERFWWRTFDGADHSQISWILEFQSWNRHERYLVQAPDFGSTETRHRWRLSRLWSAAKWSQVL